MREPKNVPELRVMMFRVDSQNPSKTPHVMLNLWSITHTSNGLIMSTEAASSWDVVPRAREGAERSTRKAEVEGFTEHFQAVSFWKSTTYRSHLTPFLDEQYGIFLQK